MTRTDKLAWGIAIVGVSLEIFIATLDMWFDMPHLIFRFMDGQGPRFEWRKM